MDLKLMLHSRKNVFPLIVLILTSFHPAEAQQTTKIPRVGYLVSRSPSPPSPYDQAFRQGLRDLGYVEGQNIIVEYRYAEGKLDRLPNLAVELVNLPVDVIVTATTPAINATKKATKTIPIIMAMAGDPVGSGHVASLARPGGNITGMSSLATEISGKRMELLKEVLGKVSRIGVLWNPDNGAMVLRMEEVKVAARALNVKLQSLEVRSPSDFDKAFGRATAERSDALLTLADPLTSLHQNRVVEFAATNRLPAMYEFTEWADAGGLMSYGPNIPDLYRRAALYVDKILKGRKPADLPVEQATKFEFVVNLKTAIQIGVTIPPNVLVRADRVIR